MTWSFDPGLSTDTDKVRFLSGDTDTTSQLVANETIVGVLTMYGNVFRSAAAICRAIAAKFSRQADEAIDDMRKNLSQRATAYAARARELDDQAVALTAVGATPMPFAGGISIGDKETRADDADRVDPFFTRDMMEGTPSLVTDQNDED